MNCDPVFEGGAAKGMVFVFDIEKYRAARTLLPPGSAVADLWGSSASHSLTRLRLAQSRCAAREDRR
jgi:hypothetical protein